jgi:MerR family copper efflux transcriptional regulator
MSCDRQTGAVASSDEGLMTVGELARRTGLSIKAIREFEASGLIYSAGRSQSNYRLFDDTALLCAEVLRNLRSLGLTVKEIEQLADFFHRQPDEPLGHLAAVLLRVEQRIDQRLAELDELRGRVAAYRAEHADALAGRSDLSSALIGRPGVDLRAAFARGQNSKDRARRTGRRHAA